VLALAGDSTISSVPLPPVFLAFGSASTSSTSPVSASMTSAGGGADLRAGLARRAVAGPFEAPPRSVGAALLSVAVFATVGSAAAALPGRLREGLGFALVIAGPGLPV